jgi:peptide-methionine (R)-S-oxide reductase
MFEKRAYKLKSRLQQSTVPAAEASGPESTRRTWLVSAASLLALGALVRGETMFGIRSSSTAEAAEKMAGGDVMIENFSPAGKSLGTVKVAKAVKPDAEWKKQLADSLTFEVTRHADTERPYTGKYNKNHAEGIYTCICCGTALFDSSTKFDSGTGWPSFWQPISKANVEEIEDRTFGMRRVAVECKRCNSHLGHVFDDGPKPTGLRYCMNSVSLNFIARA